MNSGLVYHLENVRWQFFGTLTFKRESMPKFARYTMFFSLMRSAAKQYNVHFKRLPWCLREEVGEKFGREHFHFLLAGLPTSKMTNYKSTAFLLMKQWEELGGGIARVRKYDYKLKGVSYLTKEDEGWNHNSANQYELSKFQKETANLTLSDALKQLLVLRRK